MTPAEKQALRDALWPKVRDLAQAPDLMDRVVQQVQAMGVVNERELIMLIYIAATSRVLASSVECFGKGCQQRRQIIHDDANTGADRPGLREPPDEQQRAVPGL